MLNGDLVGDPLIEITGVSEIQSGKPGTITFLANPKYNKYAAGTKASAVVLTNQEFLGEKNGIIVKNPPLAFAKVLKQFIPPIKVTPGIHTTAIIYPEATIHDTVSIGPYVVIGKKVTLEKNTRISAHCFIGDSCTIGENTILHPHVTLYHHCQIGSDSVISSGTVIGSDGFGYVTHERKHLKIPQNGGVVIGSGVEIGSNVSIDRGTISNTTIGDNTKLDNLIHIAHNVQIGRGCLITGTVAIAGSAIIGNYCSFGGQAGVAPHVTIGDHSVIAAKTGVTKSLEGGKVYAGMPAREIGEQNRRDAMVGQVEKILARVKVLEDIVGKKDKKNG